MLNHFSSVCMHAQQRSVHVFHMDSDSTQHPSLVEDILMVTLSPDISTTMEQVNTVLTVTFSSDVLTTTEQVNAVLTSYLKRIFADMHIHRNLVTFQVDSGAMCNILPTKHPHGQSYEVEETDHTL